MGQVIVISLVIVTVIAIGAWIWAATHDGAVGLMAFWTVVTAGCLIVGVAYQVHANHHRQVAQSKVVKTPKKLKDSTYFNEQAKQTAAQKKQALQAKNLLKQLRSTYQATIGPVTFDAAKKRYVVHVKKAAYQQALKMIREHPKANQKARRTIRTSFSEATKVMDQALKQPGYQLVLMANEQVVLVAQDDRIVVDRLSE
jgi:phosphotransferase system IIB component